MTYQILTNNNQSNQSIIYANIIKSNVYKSQMCGNTSMMILNKEQTKK